MKKYSKRAKPAWETAQMRFLLVFTTIAAVIWIVSNDTVVVRYAAAFCVGSGLTVLTGLLAELRKERQLEAYSRAVHQPGGADITFIGFIRSPEDMDDQVDTGGDTPCTTSSKR